MKGDNSESVPLWRVWKMSEFANTESKFILQFGAYVRSIADVY